jgi:hypothetical protein
MTFLDHMTTKHTFSGGENVSLLHRFALELEIGERFVEVGFEQAFEHGVERLIHEGSIQVWKRCKAMSQSRRPKGPPFLG